MNITEFLEARIAEDEQLARAASHQKIAGPFHGNWRKDSLHLSGMEREDAAHIARHDPARVLAECAVKREIIHWWVDGLIGYVRVNDGELTNPLLPLAAVYASHPDYQQEWAL